MTAIASNPHKHHMGLVSAKFHKAKWQEPPITYYAQCVTPVLKDCFKKWNVFPFHSKDPEGSEVTETRKKIFLLELSVFLTLRFHLILSILNDLLVQLFLWKAVKVTGLLNSLTEPSTCGWKMLMFWLLLTCRWMSFLPNGGWHLLGLYCIEMGAGTDTITASCKHHAGLFIQFSEHLPQQNPGSRHCGR